MARFDKSSFLVRNKEYLTRNIVRTGVYNYLNKLDMPFDVCDECDKLLIGWDIDFYGVEHIIYQGSDGIVCGECGKKLMEEKN